MKINNYHKATSLDDAYEVLNRNDKNLVIGGGAWLRLTNKEVDTVIDLDTINLNQIIVKEDVIEIGSMTTLHDIELNNELNQHYDGILVDAIKTIMGVQIRNIATIGGSIIGKYSFSDILTPLLVMDTVLVFHKQGSITLENFLKLKRIPKDILVKLVIRRHPARGYFKKVKKTSLDFAVVNVAISRNEEIMIAVGARPSLATISEEAVAYINGAKRIDEEVIIRTAEMVASELKFGTNSRASKEYRQELVKVYVKRGLKEVIKDEN